MASKRMNQVDRPMGLPTVEETTNGQITTLLSTANVLSQFVLAPQRNPFSDELPNRPELDGGLKCAVEVALCKVCARIEQIADDDKRWTVEHIGKIENALVKMIDADRKSHEMRAQALATAESPHVVMRTSVGWSQKTNTWVCLVPDSLLAEVSPLFGQGDTPAEACAEFNRKFYEQHASNQTVDPGRTGDPIEELESESGDDAPLNSSESDSGGSHPKKGKTTRRAARKGASARSRGRKRPSSDASGTSDV